jgi:hypothetical protein
MMLSMSFLEVENAKKKENMMWPFVRNDNNNCYVVDYLSNFASIITVGKEIVDMSLDSSMKLADNCTCLQGFIAALVSKASLSSTLLAVELALSLSGSLLTME